MRNNYPFKIPLQNIVNRFFEFGFVSQKEEFEQSGWAELVISAI
jgi:hypothetical protein